MSKTLKLSAVILAFLGDADSAVTIVGDAIESALCIMLIDGTKAPFDDACGIVGKLTGRTLKERAMRAGFDALKGCKIGAAGKFKGQESEAQAHADAAASAFTLACGEVLTAPKATPTPVSAADKIARALKALASVSDAQFDKAMQGSAGATLLARIAILEGQHAAHAAEKAKQGAAAALAKASQAPALV